MAKLSLACRTGQADDIDRRAQAALYIENLSDLPLQFLAEAVDEWIKTQTFWPSIAELREVAIRKRTAAEAKLRERQWAKDKAEIERAEAQAQRPTAEQMEKIKAEIAERWEKP